MIEINLLPGARRTKSAARQPLDVKQFAAGMSGRFRDRYLVIAVGVTIVAVIAAAGLYFQQTTKDQSLASRHDQATADSTRYANFLKDRAHAESVRDTLLRQVNIIRGLDEDRYVWPHVLDEVSRILPQYTWLTSISFTGAAQGSNNVVSSPKIVEDTSAAAKRRKPKRLETDIPKDTIKVMIKGRTVDIQAFTRLMSDLEASPYFAVVQIDKVEQASDQGKEVTEFQLTVGYTRPDTLLLRRVPLSLSTVVVAPGGR